MRQRELNEAFLRPHGCDTGFDLASALNKTPV